MRVYASLGSASQRISSLVVFLTWWEDLRYRNKNHPTKEEKLMAEKTLEERIAELEEKVKALDTYVRSLGSKVNKKLPNSRAVGPR